MRHPSARVAILPLLALALAAEGRPAAAQRRPTTTGAVGRAAVRAELAAVLLQSGRYDEAAREYRALLARDGRSRAHRLNLARALAWGDRPREAEPILHQLARERPSDGEVRALLREVRADLEPRSSEAVAWLGEDPGWTPYRVALARALARDGHPRLAIEQYRMLLEATGAPGMPPAAALRAELADAYVAAGDLAAAIARYDAMLATAPSASLYAERARIHLAIGDRAAARADVASSIRVGPSVEGYMMLGELHYESGDRAAARQAWLAAAALGREGSRSAAPALARLAREERPAAALVPTTGSDPGPEATAEGATDDLGVSFLRIGAREAAEVGPVVLSVGGDYRMFAERVDGRSEALNGVGASIGVSRQLEHGRQLVRLGVLGGLVRHDGVPVIGEGAARIALWHDAWQVALGVAREAAYPSLFTLAALRPGDGGRPLVADNLSAAIAGPLGGADLAVSAERSRLSDGNRRTTLQLYTRYALAGGLYGVYAAGADGFAERSTRYWDPVRYVTHAVGVEYAVRNVRGLSWAVRAMPGVAATHELATVLSPAGPSGEDSVLTREAVRSNALQLQAGGDLSWRMLGWEAAASIGYGRGRAGGYHRLGAMLALRRVP